jgi:hypothetical protein
MIKYGFARGDGFISVYWGGGMNFSCWGSGCMKNSNRLIVGLHLLLWWAVRSDFLLFVVVMLWEWGTKAEIISKYWVLGIISKLGFVLE